MARWRPGDVFGALLFALLLGVRLRQGLEGSALAWVLAAQAGITSVLFLVRRAERASAPLSQKLTAWAAVLLPFGLRAWSGWAGVWPWLAGLGVMISLLGLLSLGGSFGVAPADRGLVRSGAYRLLRHPMYLGELLSYAATVMAWPGAWNLALFALLAALFVRRILWEEGVIAGYEEYRNTVRWRLIPWVW